MRVSGGGVTGLRGVTAPGAHPTDAVNIRVKVARVDGQVKVDDVAHVW